MNVKEKFSRAEVVVLSGATLNQLRYLDKAQLVVPERIWNGRKIPDIYYTWEQILEIRAIRSLRESASLQTIRKVLEYFRDFEENPKLADKHIIALDNGEVFWIQNDWKDFGEKLAVKIADRYGRSVGQYTLVVIPAIADLIAEVWKAAEESEVISLEEFVTRAKEQPQGGSKTA